MAPRAASAVLADLPEPWWSASPFQTGSIPVPAPRPREPRRPPGPRTRPAKPARPAKTADPGKKAHRVPARTGPGPVPVATPTVSRRRQMRRAVAPRLEVRIHRRSRYRLRFPVVVGLLAMVCVVLMPLGLNLAADRADWKTVGLTQAKQQLTDEQVGLNADMARLTAPDHLRQLAEAMGMGPARHGYLNVEGPGPLADTGAAAAEPLP